MAPKRKRNPKNDEYWDSVVGRRSSTRERKPTAKIQAIGMDPDHPTDEQARNSPLAAEWAKARAKEQAQLEKYGVFTKVDKLPEGVKPVDTKWVYTVKRKPDGSIEKYKARKVGRGFSQEEGVSYDADQTFAQMMRPETFKILLVIALHRNWAIRQWDVVAAYLQALLHHDVYISDINENRETKYWKLHKALYELKQAGHEWYQTLKEILWSAGLEQYLGDKGTYVSTSGDQIIGTHVDDLIGIAPEESTLDWIEQSIKKTVELEKSGRPTKALGIELLWNNTEVILTQCALIESIHQRYGRSGIKSSLPLDERFYASRTDEEQAPQKEYQSLIGGQLFIARMTRSEISIHVNLLGRRAQNPSIHNLEAARRVLQYLKSTLQKGIVLQKPLNLELKIFADASYGDKGETSRSQTRVLTTLGEQPIGWYSR